MPVNHNTFQELVGDVLASLAFADARPSEAVFRWSQPGLFWSEIRLDAPHTGQVTLALPRPLAVELADDALGGLPPSLTEAALPDFLGELSNTLAGNLLARLHPGKPIALGLPQTGRGPRPAPAGHTFSFDVGGTSLGLTLETAACASS